MRHAPLTSALGWYRASVGVPGTLAAELSWCTRLTYFQLDPSLLQLLDDDGAAALDAEVGEGLGVIVERLGDLLLGVGVGVGLGLGLGYG
tara:strand:+ start:173 stop:442 length:270 start_codon:yes stop_codon:yes gene_type:complete